MRSPRALMRFSYLITLPMTFLCRAVHNPVASGLLLLLTICFCSNAQGVGKCPAPSTNAFTGCYYDNITLTGDPVFIRTDKAIDFYWGNGSPDKSLQPLDFSARWQGNFAFTQGNYT